VTPPLQIRPYDPADWPAVWALLEPVFRAGDTFPHDPAIPEEQARALWVEHSQAVMVAVDRAGDLVGTYYLRPNSIALGAHVANAGYVVAEHCRRQGIGSRLCQHSLPAAQWLSDRRHPARGVQASAAGLRRCTGDDSAAGGGAWPMNVVPLRLMPGADLRNALEAWMGAQEQTAGCVISAVGSLSVAQLRLAGTLTPNGAHHRGAPDHSSLSELRGSRRHSTCRNTNQATPALMPPVQSLRSRKRPTGSMR